MRDLIKIVEGLFYRGEFKPKYGVMESEITILENPTKSEFRGFKKRAEFNSLRAILNRSLYVWDASIANHADVMAYFDLHGYNLHMEDDNVVVLDISPSIGRDKAAKIASNIKQHQSVISVYGANVPVNLVTDNGVILWSY